MMNCFFSIDFFSGIPILILIFFTIILAIIGFQIIKGIKQWFDNNSQAQETILVTVVSKRTNNFSSTTPSTSDMFQRTSNTSYYVTFELSPHSRIEFLVTGKQYGFIATGDIGQLTYQGTRFISFER